MADRTSQPPAGVGVRADYSSAAKFLWNAIDPGKNQLTGASTTTAIRGTAVSGADGTFRHFTNTDGSINFAVSNTAMATNGYTLAVGFAAPSASVYITQTIVLPGSLRLELGTTDHGVYATLVHSGIATAANTFVESVSGFDTEMWTYIATHTGSDGSPANELRQYLLRGDGTVVATLTETLTGPNSSGTSFEVGSSFGNPTQGIYAALWMAASIDDTEAVALRDNIWRAFAPESGLSTTPLKTQTYRRR